MRVQYRVIKLINYRSNLDALEASKNPFASVILVQLTAIGISNKKQEERKCVKSMLTRKLYEKSYCKEQILNLYHFIDWLISLPKSLELEYLNEVHELEEAKKMAYVTSAERYKKELAMMIGLKKGRKEGLEKRLGKGIDTATKMIAKRLLAMRQDSSLVATVTKLSLHEIKKLQKET